ncbi:MAG TPA: class I SAM-dependent methyltransferase, partial [Thermoplasmata archaeon]|nr:class I SAM-dependent methyltransferase [Thermoplasmata archaeon]
DLSRLDRTKQLVTTVRLTFGKGGYAMMPLQIRFAWPEELDQMAKKAGLRLKGRWDGWKGEPFKAGTKGYVSAWETA